MLKTQFTNYEEIARSAPSVVFGTSPSVLVYASYNDRGAYLWCYHGYQFLEPSKVCTIEGESPPQEIEAFNKWMGTLKSFHPLHKERSAA